MILVAGLSPAWQQTVSLPSLQVGEVNRARSVVWCASGKVLNVGRALHSLGASCRVLATVGGISGEQIQREFRDSGIPCRWVETQSATRVCTTLLDESTGTTTEIVENALPIDDVELREFRAAFEDESSRADLIVLTGSFPPGVPSSLYGDLLARTRVPVLLDAQGPPLLQALPYRPFLIKPNREELARTLGNTIDDEASLPEALGAALGLGAQNIIVTQGRGTVWMASRQGMHTAQPPGLRVVNPIGSGDCLAAGVAWALQSGEQLPDALRYGLAAAADNVGQLLPARLDANRVSTIARGIEVRSA